MRIALMAPLVSPIAPPYLGGAQALLADLAAGLAGRGHQVTLFAAAGSVAPAPGVVVRDLGIDWRQLTPARFDLPTPAGQETGSTPHLPAGWETGGTPRPASANEFAAKGVPPASPWRDSPGPAAGQETGATPRPPAGWETGGTPQPPDAGFFVSAQAFLRVFSQLQAELESYDVVHAHAFDWPAFAYGALIARQRPMLHTLHLPAVNPVINALLRDLRASGNPTRLITVSQACAATYAPYTLMDAIIPNGINTAAIPFGAAADPEDFLLFAGRISPEKGVVEAIEIARRAGRRLVVAGGVYDTVYMETRVRPLLAGGGVPPVSQPAVAGDVLPASAPVWGGGADYLGQLAHADLWRLMSRASGLLLPIGWEEPFGLVAAEALAAGCPVIAFARGALPEIITEGETGFLIPPGNLEDAARAVAAIPSLSRAACRARAVEQFSLAKMLDEHERVYQDFPDNPLAT